MSSKAVTIGENLKNVQGGQKPKATPNAPQTKKVRLSADIGSEAYRELVSWCQDVAFQLGRTRVQHVWVLRALVDELMDNGELQSRIVERLVDEHIPEEG